MKNRWYKYLCLCIVVLASIRWSANTDSAATESQSEEFRTEYNTYTYESPISDLAICRPRQISAVVVFRQYTTGKRQHNTHRNSYDYIKSGKLINSEIINSTLTSNLISYSSFTKPASRLAALGKLII